MFRGRVMVARARGRTLRRLERNARTGETLLPRRGWLRRESMPPLPPLESRPALRAVPGGRTATLVRPHNRADGPVDGPVDRTDDPGDDAVDGQVMDADDRVDGPVDGAGRSGGRPRGVRSLLPPRPERDGHDWDVDGPPEPGAQRRPLVPVWLLDPVPTIRWWLRDKAHFGAFHVLRSPVYVCRAVAWTPRGLGRVVVGLWRWCSDAEGHELRWSAVEHQDVAGYLHLSRQRNDRVRIRGSVTAVLAVAMLAVGVVGWMDPGGRALVVAVMVAVGGWFGRPADRPLFDHPVVAPSGVRITPDLLVEAFCAARLCNKHEDPDRHQTISFLSPVHRDGKGWRAVVDLPAGHPASKAIARKEGIAAGLGIDEVRVFTDRVRGDDGSARRVTMWVADKDPYAAPPVTSPLAKAQRWTFWDGVPFGVDARGQQVTLLMLFTNLLVGAIPRMGKTYAARIPAAAAALDALVRLVFFDGKGGADWRPFEQVAYRCGFGARDPVVAHLVLVLDECLADMDRRYDTLGTLPPDVIPESRITPAICANKRLAMRPVLICVDEIQEYLGHPVHGQRILEQLMRLAKVGPAVGYMLDLATQRPDSDTIPAGLRDVLGSRFALKTMTWQSSETILGAGSYKAGLDASKFQRSHKGVGILHGADDGDLADEGPQTVRTHLLDRAALDAICARGRALRLAAGTLEGAATGEQLIDETSSRSVLDDVASVFGAGEDKLWSETICARLTEDHPDAYSGWGPNELAAALAPHGVDTGQVWGKDDAGVGRNRRGVARQHVLDALAARADRPPAARDGALAPRGGLAPEGARSSTPASGPDQATSGLAPTAGTADLPDDQESPPEPLAASGTDPPGPPDLNRRPLRPDQP
ncbi:MAG: cell division protein FtsK [Acidimicrobiales bacterium]